MLTVKEVYVLLSIYISFCFAFHRSSQLGKVCGNEGNCEWIPKTLYTGCLPADMCALTFIFFDSSSYIDLSCTSVEVVNIQSSELTCSRMSSLLTTSGTVSLQIGANSCVSIDYTCKCGLFFFSSSQPFYQLYNHYDQQPPAFPSIINIKGYCKNKNAKQKLR